MICVSTNTRAAWKLDMQMSAYYVCTPLENKIYFLHPPGKISAGAHAQFLDDYTEVKDREIILCWVPSHVGIRGNESADQAAKETLQQEVTEMFIPHSDYKEFINMLSR